MAEKKEQMMEYRTLGETGLKVSVLGYGFWGTFGVKEKGNERIEMAVKNSLPILKALRAHGVNFFDNAETYGTEVGDAERIMGQAIITLRKESPDLWRRSDIVMTTKIFWGGKGLNEKGLSRKHLMEGLNASLKRFHMDYVDVVYCHRPDPLTPTEEIVRGMTFLINQGKALYWGTSEWSAQQITEAFWIAKMNNLIAPVVEQPQYNLFERERVEKEYRRLYDAPYGLGLTTWGPLKSGWLTGKYNKEIPESSRLNTYKFLAQDFETAQKERVPKIEALNKFAKESFGSNSTTLAIAWVLMNKNVSCCLLGASKLEQIEENLKAFEVATKLKKEHVDKIDKIFDNKPNIPRAGGTQLTKIIDSQ